MDNFVKILIEVKDFANIGYFGEKDFANIGYFDDKDFANMNFTYFCKKINTFFL